MKRFSTQSVEGVHTLLWVFVILFAVVGIQVTRMRIVTLEDGLMLTISPLFIVHFLEGRFPRWFTLMAAKRIIGPNGEVLAEFPKPYFVRTRTLERFLFLQSGRVVSYKPWEEKQ